MTVIAYNLNSWKFKRDWRWRARCINNLHYTRHACHLPQSIRKTFPSNHVSSKLMKQPRLLPKPDIHPLPHRLRVLLTGGGGGTERSSPRSDGTIAVHRRRHAAGIHFGDFTSDRAGEVLKRSNVVGRG